MDLIQRACQTEFDNSTANTMQKIIGIDDDDCNRTDDKETESMLAFMGDNAILLVLSSLVYKYGSTLSYNRQYSIANHLANDDNVLNKMAELIELEDVIYRFNSNIKIDDQILHRKLKAVIGIIAIHDSWDNLRDCISDWLSTHVQNYIANNTDSSKSRNGAAKDNETKLQLNRNSQVLNNGIEKLSQEFRRTSLGKHTREDHLKYSAIENQKVYDELQNELSRPETNNNSPGKMLIVYVYVIYSTRNNAYH